MGKCERGDEAVKKRLSSLLRRLADWLDGSRREPEVDAIDLNFINSIYSQVISDGFTEIKKNT